MTDKEHNQIIQYLKGQCPKDEKSEVEQWINSSDENKNLYEKIRRMFIEKDEKILGFNLKNEALRKTIEPGIKPTKKMLQQQIIAAVSIAAVIVVLIIGFYSTHQILSVKADTFFYATSQTYHADTIKKIELPDGSLVWLNSGSDFGVDTAYNKTERKVYLKGEGYFKVALDTTRTFFVITGQTVSKALGTSFNIKEKLGYTVIDVLAGKVSFSDIKNARSVELLTGEHADYYTRKEILLKTRTKSPNFMAWQNKRFEFKNEQLQVACIALAKVYGFTFNIKNEELREKKITVSFNNQTINEIFTLLAQTVNCDVKVNKNHITLSRK